MYNKLYNKIDSKKAKIGIIGLGYVGLPLAYRFSDEGFRTLGFEIDNEKVVMLNKGKSYIKHIKSSSISKMLQKKFQATNDFNRISELNVIIICVPTPLKNNNEPDLSFIINTVKQIKDNLLKGQLLILESTSYPGTTEENIVSIVDRIKELAIGTNFFIGYSPEREDPGNQDFTIKTIPKIVSGFSENCLELVSLLYNKIVEKTVPVSSIRVAEMTKILENIYRSVNIGLVNELKIVADKINIDIYEVINAAATKPFGFQPFFPGPGLGGHCVPIDPFYLSWKAKQVGVETRFIHLAGEINKEMPKYIIDKIKIELSKSGVKIKNSKILVLGLAYKKNIGDTRESPSLKIIDKLLKLGANVDYSDPFVPKIPRMRNYNIKLKSIALTSKLVNDFDIVLLVTDHDSFDYKMIQKNAKIVIDTRGSFSLKKNIIRA